MSDLGPTQLEWVKESPAKADMELRSLRCEVQALISIVSDLLYDMPQVVRNTDWVSDVRRQARLDALAQFEDEMRIRAKHARGDGK